MKWHFIALLSIIVISIVAGSLYLIYPEAVTDMISTRADVLEGFWSQKIAFSVSASQPVLTYQYISDDHFKVRNQFGDRADVYFGAKNLAGNELPVASIVGFDLIKQDIEGGIKYGYKLRLPNPAFRGRIEVICNKNIIDGKCGNLNFGFDDLNEEINYTDDDGINYPLQSFNTEKVTNTKNFTVYITAKPEYDLKTNDLVYLDPTITVKHSPINLIQINTTYEDLINSTRTNINSQTPYNSLVSYWNFDEDSYGLWSEGKIGNAFDFKNKNEIFRPLNFNTSIITRALNVTEGTVSFWLYHRVTQNLDGFFSTTGAVISISDSSGTMKLKMLNLTGSINVIDTNGVAIPLNMWTFWVFTFNATGGYVYLNGSLKSNDTTTEGIPYRQFAAPLFGSDGALSGRTINGKMDDIAIYNRSMTIQEIDALYNRTYTGLNNNITDSRIGYWDFNESTGTIANDSSGNNNTAYLLGISSNMYDFASDNDGNYTTGAYNYGGGFIDDSSNFDGSNDYITINERNDILTNFNNITISLWFRSNSSQATQVLYQKSATDFSMRFAGGNTLFAQHNRLNVTSTQSPVITTLTNNEWHHVAFTWENGSAALYFDGNNVKNSSPSGYLNLTSGTSCRVWRMGDGACTGGNYFNGSMDEIMIFNSSLTAQQIASIYNNQSARFYASGENVYYMQNNLSGANRINISLSGRLKKNSGSNVGVKIATINTSVNSYNSTIPNKNITSYVQLDNTTIGDSETLAVGLQGTTNWTILGGATLINGQYKKARLLDGSNDYLSTSDFGSTISFWMKPSIIFSNDSGDSNYPIVSRYVNCYAGGIWCGYLLDYNSTDATSSQLRLTSFNGDTGTSSTLTTTLNATEWYHIALSINNTGGGVTMALNGNPTLSSGTWDIYSPANYYVGNYSSSAYNIGMLPATIDEIITFNRILTGNEIKGLAYCGNTDCLNSNNGAGILVNHTATEYQDLTINTNITFNISKAEKFFIITNQSTGTNQFYTSILEGTLIAETFNVSEGDTPIADTIIPNVTSLEEPIDPATYSPTATYQFNATVVDNANISTVILIFNGTNYTASNITLTKYNFTISNLGAGTYSYTWYANDTSNNVNSSESGTFTVNKASQSITPLLNGVNSNLAVTYPQQVNASFSGTNNTVVTIQLNGTTLARAINYTIGGGFWTINYTLTTNQNYSNQNSYLNVTVNKGTGIVRTHINHTRSNKNYGNSTVVSLNSTLETREFGFLNLTINNSQLNYSNSNIVNVYNFSNLGTFVIKTNYSGSQNYTSVTEQWTVTISAPSVPGTSTTTTTPRCKYKGYGYYNTHLPWFREVNCI